MKKTISLILISTMLAVLTGCGGDTDIKDLEVSTSDNTGNVNETEETQEVTEEEIKEETKEETKEEIQEETKEDTNNDELQDYIDLEFVDKDGNIVKISDYEGKFIALNFFGVWCKYCMEEMPDLEKVYDEYEGDDFVILLVNATTTEKISKEEVIKWYEESGYTMPLVLDLDGTGIATYPVQGFPTTYFINKEGKILGGIPGMLDEEMLLSIIETYNN